MTTLCTADHLLLVPAEGVDYAIAQEVEAAYNANAEFRCLDPLRGWTAIHRGDIVGYTRIQQVTVWYRGVTALCRFNARMPHH